MYEGNTVERAVIDLALSGARDDGPPEEGAVFVWESEFESLGIRQIYHCLERIPSLYERMKSADPPGDDPGLWWDRPAWVVISYQRVGGVWTKMVETSITLIFNDDIPELEGSTKPKRVGVVPFV